MSVRKYGKTENEQKVLQTLQCREIVSEITKFGVGEDQLLQIIKFLAMELEKRESMLSVVDVIDRIRCDNDKLIVDE
jgi:hypothetical protein